MLKKQNDYTLHYKENGFVVEIFKSRL